MTIVNTRVPRPAVLSGVRALADLGKYKGVLLDQFGVLHDGQTPYPGAIEAVRFLAEDAGLKILLLSNSSRRSSGATKSLAKKGFKESWFQGVVTSGEITHFNLLHRPDAFWQGLGTRCLHFNWAERGAISLDGLGLDIVMSAQDAEFIVASGTETVGSEPRTMDEFKALLREVADEAQRRGKSIPMIVANPDIVTVAGGGLAPMPGALARVYEGFGGEVHLMGKPAPIIYERASRELGLDVSRLVAIGDSLEHDIAGSQTQSIDNVFILGGIHAAELCSASEDAAGRKRFAYDEDMFGKMAHLQASYGAHPTYAMSWFEV